MKNHGNHSFGLVMFESLLVIISLVIISTNSLVIHRITKAQKKRKKKIEIDQTLLLSV